MRTQLCARRQAWPGSRLFLGGLSWLRKVCMAHTLARAIWGVEAMSDRECRDFGFDRGEVLAALRLWRACQP